LNFNEILEMYNEASPKLILFDVKQSNDEKSVLDQLSKFNPDVKANPMDIVFESWINVLSEKISETKVTFSSTRVLINSEVRDEAIQRIKDIVTKDAKRIKTFHDLWLEKFIEDFKNFYECDRKITLEEVAIHLGKQFRISTNSALRAIISVTK
jgi:hypothetical protein